MAADRTGPKLTRRLWLGGMALALLPGKAPAFARKPPARVACLEWTSAEMAVSLGLEPICVGDRRGYQDWVTGPALPDGTIDLGSRSEPNLELLRELGPDLIMGAYGYGLDEHAFARFAPTFNIRFYDGSAPPFAQAVSETLRLGKKLARETEAANLIARVEHRIDALRTTMRSREPLCIVSMFDDRHVRVYGKGSLFQDVLDRLGRVNAWTRDTNSWGFSMVGIEELVAIGNARLISLQPIPAHVRIRIEQSALWNNLPCVRNGRVVAIAPVWPFGGLAAAERFAGLLAAA